MIRLRLKRANAMLAERRNLAPWLENDLMWYTCACVREKVKTRQKRNEMEIQGAHAARQYSQQVPALHFSKHY
jgi:hypothetical protein